MKFEKYKKKYNFAPYTTIEFAQGAMEIEDDDELMKYAKNYIDALNEFDKALEERDINYG